MSALSRLFRLSRRGPLPRLVHHLAPTLAGLALALAAAVAPAAEALFTHAARDLGAEARAAKAEGKKLAVWFTLPDCAGCKEMERSVFANPALGQRFDHQYRHVRLDLAGNDPVLDAAGQPVGAPDLARSLGVVATPSFAFFDGQGQLLYRHTGTLSRGDFSRLARYVARAEYENLPFRASPPPRAAKGDGHDHGAHPHGH